ncbi:MAG: Z1 domain-containing protein [Candidatus Scalindua sp.]|nr:Z1 domain-containing protein [Candidatus Scalindua sp.]
MFLLEKVQSGKTGQVFGIISSSADEGFDIFILLTTDNVRLQEQTFKRALSTLDTFCIISENDELRFAQNNMRKPVLIILKKNYKVLERWRNNLSSSGFLSSGRPLFIIDDEGDAASLNTKINNQEQSTINLHIQEIKKMSTSSIYLQVTATAQALLLQTSLSGWKPQFVYYFRPGKNYLGGNFFYSDPQSYVIKLIEEDELDNLKSDEDYITQGLSKALLTFLVTSAHIFLSKISNVCNFLIHPSVRISDHNIAANKIGEFLNQLVIADNENCLKDELKEIWLELQKTQPDLYDFDKSFDFINQNLTAQKIKIITMNSDSPSNTEHEIGINVIIGGNSLGRGVTFNSLQTIYYSRKAKIPQADTFWQHCRMFGYDRIPALMRIFISPLLHKLFSNLNKSNNALIEHIMINGLDNLNIVTPEGVNPTRKNILEKDSLIITVGGVNYFPNYPINKSIKGIDTILNDFLDDNYSECQLDTITEILSLMNSEQPEEWNSQGFKACVKMLAETHKTEKGIIIIRKDRKISKGTGTLLSESDRKLGDRFKDRLTLTLYKITGEKKLGWDDIPLWVPNIKFPEGFVFYRTE